MNRHDRLERENESLRGRLYCLSEANSRINESLDLEAALLGVLDSATSLTEARYGAITLPDDGERIEIFLSSGITTKKAWQIWETPGGIRIVEYSCSLLQPLIIPDSLGYLRSLSLLEFQSPVSVQDVLSFLAAPILHSRKCRTQIHGRQER